MCKMLSLTKDWYLLIKSSKTELSISLEIGIHFSPIIQVNLSGTHSALINILFDMQEFPKSTAVPIPGRQRPICASLTIFAKPATDHSDFTRK